MREKSDGWLPAELGNAGRAIGEGMNINGKEIDIRAVRMKTMREDGSGLTLSQSDVARACGISIIAYQHYEDGTTKNPRPETVEKLVKFLHLEA